MGPDDIDWIAWTLFVVQVLTLAALVVYVVKTWEMASATKEAAKASAAMAKASYDARMEGMAPQVLVYFDPESMFGVDIVVENAGRGTATNVEFTFDPLLVSPDDLDAARFFEAPKAVIPPSARVRHNIGTWPSLLNSDCPRRYEVTVQYEGAENHRSYEATHVLDVSDHEHRMQLREKGMHDLVREMERLRQSLDRHARDVIRNETKYRAGARYHATRRNDLEECLQAIRAKWPLIRDKALDGFHDVWWEPAVEDLRTEVINAMVLAQEETIVDETREAVQGLSEAILRRERVSDDEWVRRVDEAVAKLSN